MKKTLYINKLKPPTEKIKMEVNLEDALDLAGAGKYQLFHCTLMLATLSAALIEMIGSAFILPAAACDLDLPDSLKGILISMPNIGVILTAPFWGRAADSLGRKPVLLCSAAASGVLGFAASVMPNLVTFALCKLAASLFLSCPSSLGWAYASEMLPQKRRDLALLIMNGFLTTSSTLSPLLAWGILPFDWTQIGIQVHPWRFLTAAYALPLLLVAVWLTQAKESPKFLMTKGKQQEALTVLGHIYARNHGAPVDAYPVTALKKSNGKSDHASEEGSSCELAPIRRSETACALLRPPHLKWLALTGFLMFGLFSLLNGLFLFAPDTINKVMQGSGEEEGTICIIMNQAVNETVSPDCVDSISQDTFIIMAVTTVVYGLAVMAVSLIPISKKTLLVGMYFCVGTNCLLSGLLKNRTVAGIMMSALQITALGIGPLTAYAVQLFPTTLRGTAVGAVLMFGRLGSVVGANAAGALLAAACAAAFYGFAALLFLCAALSLLLPGNRSAPSEVQSEAET
ncbi:putative transporter SVOPL isoform X1 [Choristoneura fumiferana]|uniref:putative transporter SVOPL isoform X1 n=1 Tax=Choristoneura fumiferana TaxID=7141 RepID=UPI003D157507